MPLGKSGDRREHVILDEMGNVNASMSMLVAAIGREVGMEKGLKGG